MDATTVYGARDVGDGRWAVADAISALLADPSAWRFRRTERFDLRSAEEVRRHVSVDFEIPREHWAGLLARPTRNPRAPDELAAFERAAATGRDGEWIVPVTWLARGPLVGFDLKQGGNSIPMLHSSETAEITRRLLELRYYDVQASTNDPKLDALAARLIADCVAVDVRDDLLQVIDGFDERYGAPVREFAELLRVSTRGFLLLALVPAIDRRQLVKFAYDEVIPSDGPRSHVLFEAPGVFEAATSHFETQLPPELFASTWELRDAAVDEVLAATVDDRKDHPKLYVGVDSIPFPNPQQPASVPVVASALWVEVWRFHLPALFLTAATCAIVSVGAWGADVGSLVGAGRQGPLVTLLLAGVAAFLGLMLRLEEHPAARRLLVVPRTILALVLGVVIAVAASTALGSGHVDRIWTIAGGVIALLLAGLAASTVQTLDARQGQRERARER